MKWICHSLVLFFLQGKCSHEKYQRYSRPRKVDFGRRRYAPIMATEELQAISIIGETLESCIIDGFRNLQSLIPLTHIKSLRHLKMDCSSVTDNMLIEVIRHLGNLSSLSLRACVFLRGEFLECLHYLPNLEVLHMGECGIALNLHTEWSTALTSLSDLKDLDVSGNHVDDSIVCLISKFESLQSLNIRKSPELTMTGIQYLSNGSVAKTLRVLKVGGMLDQCPQDIWKFLPKFKILMAIEISDCPAFPDSGSIPDGTAASLWQLPPLQKISLVGSYKDWSMLKILSATCGNTLEYLNISGSWGISVTGSSSLSYRPHRWQDFTQGRQEEQLFFPKLKTFKAINSKLPLLLINRILQGSTELEHLDLSACNLKASNMRRRRLQFQLSGNEFSGLNFSENGINNTKSRDFTRIMTEFAEALGKLRKLSSLKCQYCSLDDIHLQCLGNLENLIELNLMGNQDITDTSMFQLSRASLQKINVLNTSISDAALLFLGRHGCKNLAEISVGGHLSVVSDEGIVELSNNAGSSLTSISITDCKYLNDTGIQKIVERFSNVRSIHLKGCSSLSEDGLRKITGWKFLEDISLSCMAKAVQDDLVKDIMSHHSSLSRLSLRGATNLSKKSWDYILSGNLLTIIDVTSCSGMGNDDESAAKIPKSSPVKIYFPQGSVRRIEA